MYSKYKEIKDEIGLTKTEDINLEKKYQRQSRQKIPILQVNFTFERTNNLQKKLENESKMTRFLEDALEISMTRADILEKQKTQLKKKLKMSKIDMDKRKASFTAQYDLQTKRALEHVQKYNEAMCKINNLEDMIEQNTQKRKMDEKQRVKEKFRLNSTSLT